MTGSVLARAPITLHDPKILEVIAMSLRHFALPLLALIAFAPGRSALAQTERIIQRFDGTNGKFPAGAVIADAAGNLYVPAMEDADEGESGLIAEFSPPTSKDAWKETILHHFDFYTDGSNPRGPLVFDSTGNLYGTNEYGGPTAGDAGTVFELSPPTVEGGAWTETMIYSFNTGPIGFFPNGGLVIDRNGNLYGTTGDTPGYCGGGSIFELSPPASTGNPWTATLVYAFSCEGGGGQYPASILMADNGTLYGVTFRGGAYGLGTVFGLTPPSGAQSGWAMHILYSFTGGSDGAIPVGLTDGHNGSFYGTTQGGGGGGCFTSLPGCGVIFELSPPQERGASWRETALYTFTGGSDGAVPMAGVILDRSGNLYGVTTGGGNDIPNCDDQIGDSGCGVAFKLVRPSSSGGAWTESVLYEFQNGSDGGAPDGALLFNGTRSELYGTTQNGGDFNCFMFGCGVLFELHP
jgi:uncharacterized repeat protein (TIGR03803 family)